MTEVYLSIGTNLGDRESNIQTALQLLEKELGSPYTRLSTIVESKAWGFEGGDFLDCAVCFDTEKTPRELLGICKKIEDAMGRKETIEYDSSGNRIYHDRIIDIDILLYGDIEVDEPDLRIPHPLIEKRSFIKGPLMEIFAGND